MNRDRGRLQKYWAIKNFFRCCASFWSYLYFDFSKHYKSSFEIIILLLPRFQKGKWRTNDCKGIWYKLYLIESFKNTSWLVTNSTLDQVFNWANFDSIAFKGKLDCCRCYCNRPGSRTFFNEISQFAEWKKLHDILGQIYLSKI